MTFERIPSPNHPLYADAMVLYGISFPAHEQRETPSQTAILTHPDYHFTAILDGSAFVGDMLYWETPDFRYIEHFCILPALRGQRYGSRAVDAALRPPGDSGNRPACGRNRHPPQGLLRALRLHSEPVSACASGVPQGRSWA